MENVDNWSDHLSGLLIILAIAGQNIINQQ